jgi:hypothetical protein
MNITITKIQLKNSGLKGIEVSYRKNDEVNHRTFNNGHKEECKHPIHLDLEKAFKELRFFLLEICKVINPGMEQDEVEDALADTLIDSVSIDDNAFIIRGELAVNQTPKYIKLETPEIDADDDYHNFDAVLKVIDTIKTETLLHMEGKKKVSDKEYLTRWAEANTNKLTPEEIEGMSEEELKDFCTKVLEKQGSLVYHADDLETEPEAEETHDLRMLGQ